GAGPTAPDEPLDLAGGGRLQALRVLDQPRLDLRSISLAGAGFAVGWTDINDPDPDITAGETVAGQAVEAGAARFRRLEGCVMDGSSVWFTSTDGGLGNGQIWRLDPDGPDGGRLTMVLAVDRSELLTGPDNLVLSPQGSLVICEDGDQGRNRVVALGPDGTLVPIAANIANEKEFAGATFSPDGATLFVNTQGSPGGGILGRTLAIWGPWENGIV
ncbi:MAG: alkaline phosphatase PhoX, partial [Actinomycetota bacterium]